MKRVKLQPCFGSRFCVYSLGNHYNQERRLIAKFTQMEYDESGWRYVERYADKRGDVQDFYQMQTETKLVVSTNETFEMQIIISVLWNFVTEFQV